MKYLPFVIAVVMLTQVQAETLSYREHSTIHNTNHKPLMKLRKKNNMHRLCKIDETRAAELVRQETGEAVVRMKLTHRGKWLFYKISTENYDIELNALSGKVIRKEGA